MNYYNEHDPKAAAWLRELIRAGEIPAGLVDERSITEIKPNELTEYAQCHFFAGIGGWSLALKLAGWPATRKVWSGSCPCQPFSSAGQGLGEADERHLWPVFRNLIGECRPPVVFGEQVASKAGLQWLDGVCADMEAAGYAIGAADLCAASVGAPHIRQRLYWVADSASERRNGSAGMPRTNGLGITETSIGLGHADDAGSQGQRRLIELNDAERRQIAERYNPASGFWGGYNLLQCTDGKTRRIESGSFPLAHGISGRVGLLRGFGNAIVPQVACEFISAWLDTSNVKSSHSPVEEK